MAVETSLTAPQSSAPSSAGLGDHQPYWATLDGDELGAAVMMRCNAFYAHPLVRAVLSRMAAAWGYFYGYGTDWFHGTSAVTRFGSRGALAAMRVNTLRRVCTAWFSGIVARQPKWKPVPDRWNSAGLRGKTAATQTLDDAWHYQGVQRKMTLATESAAYSGEGLLLGRFNPLAGRVIDTDGERTVHAGAVTYSNHSGWQLVRNPTMRHYDDRKWVVLVDRENKYDLAADPRLTDAQRMRVLDSTSVASTSQWFWIGLLSAQPGLWDDDDIPVLRLYHEPTAALPYGKQATFLTDGTMLGKSQAIVGGVIPIARITPGEMDTTPFGYTGFFDGMASQSVKDHLISAAATNYGAFARQAIAMKVGESASNIQRLNDLAILWYDEVKPEGINLTAMAQGWDRFDGMLTNEIVQSMGQSDVSLGQSPGDRAPASLGALLAATTAQGATTFAGSYEDALKYMGRVTLVQTREATEPVTVHLPGVEQGDGSASIDVSDLKGIEYVDVDLGGPMENSPGTRIQVAEMLAAVPDPEHRKELIEIIQTDRFEPVSGSIEAEYARTTGENEQIAKGIVPDVNPADDDRFHGRQHAMMMKGGPARTDKNALRAWRLHLGLHYVQEYAIPTRVRPDTKNIWAPVNDQFLSDIGDLPMFDASGAQVGGGDPQFPLRERRLLGKPPPLEMQQAQIGPPGAPGGGDGGKPSGGPAGSPAKPPGPSPSDPAKLPPMPKNAATGLSSATPDRGGVPAPGTQIQ